MPRGKRWSEPRHMKEQPEDAVLGFRNIDTRVAIDLYYRLTGNRPDEESFTTLEQSTIEQIDLFGAFRNRLQESGIMVSTPEWLTFIALTDAVMKNDALVGEGFFARLRSVGQMTLVKKKELFSVYHNEFNMYFGAVVEHIAHAIEQAKEKTRKEQDKQNQLDRSHVTLGDIIPQAIQEAELPDKEFIEEQEEYTPEDNPEEPDIKEQLGIQEVDENLQVPDGPHDSENEQVHGGNTDQHNDILRQQDESKQGGGQEGKNTEPSNSSTPQDPLKKGNSPGVVRLDTQPDNAKSAIVDVAPEDITVGLNRRPESHEIRRLVHKLHGILEESPAFRSTKRLDLKRTTEQFSRGVQRFEYTKERENNEPRVVLFIDVGGPVDQWSPLMLELVDGMTKGLSDLDVYMFHNNIYGYVWKANKNDITSARYPEPNSLISVDNIVDSESKVIIYGDAEMSENELNTDHWPPKQNDFRLRRYRQDGMDCLHGIRRNADTVVWINPVLKTDWGKDRRYDTIADIAKEIPMFDLTLSGLEEAIRLIAK